MIDVAIIGAGPAGIAAGRALLASGRSVLLIEARGRIGGRTLTLPFAGRPVDLGAHWLHAGPINPVVRLARSLGWRMARAPQERHLFVDGRPARAAEDRAYEMAFARADAALTRGAGGVRDVAADALPQLGPWKAPVAAITGLVCGRPLRDISHADFASAEYADNLFAPGGFGALLARLGRGLPVRLGAPVSAVDWSGKGVSIETPAGRIAARACIVTVPPIVLQRGAVRFSPALPQATGEAIARFRPAIYEHVLLRWPGAPFRGRDRIATLTGRRLPGLGLLTRLDGTALHYLELDAPMTEGLGPRGEAQLARDMLAAQFGRRALRGLQALHATSWRTDPWSMSSWSCAPPGAAGIRDQLAEPVGDKVFFAGEATDHLQWGTVGGAWAQGERAAAQALAALR